MMKCKKLAVLAALLSLLLLASLLVVPAAAEESVSSDPAVTTTEPATTEAGTTASTETTAPATTQAATTEADTSAEAEKKEQTTRGLINLGVGAVILIALAVVCIKFRKKIPSWLKALKSECGKISWCSKDKLKKNTLVVVIIILAITAVIAVLDFTFSSGIALLGDLF